MISCRTLLSFAGLSVLAVACSTQQPAPLVDRGQAMPRLGTASSSTAGCSDSYTVKKGDTLYSVALEHGADYKDVIVWNRIDNPNRIFAGQVLCIKAPVDTGGGAVAKPITSDGVVEKRSLDVPGGAVTFSVQANQSKDGIKREPLAGKDAYSEQAFAAVQVAGGGRFSAVEQVEQKNEAKPETKLAPQDSKDSLELVWGWPASGKTLTGFMESTKGIDIAGKQGDPVFAAADGKVVYAGVGLRGYGKLLIVKHNSSYLTAYAHNSNLLVKEGQGVVKGQKIAEIGSTGTETSKLHFEVRRQGKPVDPLKYLPPR